MHMWIICNINYTILVSIKFQICILSGIIISTANSIFQVDAAILLTANVPSAKKIIVHGPQGPDEGGIPSQFPLSEDIQFCQILQEAQDFFGIDEEEGKEYFLVDHRTR